MKFHNYPRETLKQAGYTSIKSIGNKQFELIDNTGKIEIWSSSKSFAGYAIKYKNTELEFCRSK